jgi:DNA-binding NarL/FixJ family response regulator
MVVAPQESQAAPDASAPRALLVDPQPLFLAALTVLLTSAPLNAQVVTTTSSREALEIAEEHGVDVVVCDIRSGPIDGAILSRTLAERCPGLPIILLADREDESLLVDAMSSGATGLFFKDSTVDEFLEGVSAVRRGQFTVGRSLLRQTMAKLAGLVERTAGDEIKKLSPAEFAVLTMIAQADSVAVIAQRRGISQKTVRNHLASIYRKLAVRNRTEAILWAARRGLGPPLARA